MWRLYLTYINLYISVMYDYSRKHKKQRKQKPVSSILSFFLVFIYHFYYPLLLWWWIGFPLIFLLFLFNHILMILFVLLYLHDLYINSLYFFWLNNYHTYYVVIILLFLLYWHLIEALKEQKRKEYAQKQKQKLAQYQNKVKSEAEKIQVCDGNIWSTTYVMYLLHIELLHTLLYYNFL